MSAIFSRTEKRPRAVLSGRRKWDAVHNKRDLSEARGEIASRRRADADGQTATCAAPSLPIARPSFCVALTHTHTHHPARTRCCGPRAAPPALGLTQPHMLRWRQAPCAVRPRYDSTPCYARVLDGRQPNASSAVARHETVSRLLSHQCTSARTQTRTVAHSGVLVGACGSR